MITPEVGQALVTVSAINGVVWAGVTAYAVGQLKCPVYHPFFIYLVYHGIGYVVRPIAILSNGSSPLWTRIGFAPVADDIVFASIAFNMALLGVFAGFVALRGAGPHIVRLQPIDLRIERPRLFYLVLAVLVGLGLYATSRTIGDAGNVLGYDVVIDAAGGRRLEGISGYLTSLAQFLPVVCLLLFFSARTRMLALALIAAFVLLRIYAGASRTSFVVVLLGVALFYHVLKGLRYPGLLASSGAVIGAFVFELVGNDRLAIRRVLDGSLSWGEMLESYAVRRGGNVLTSDAQEFDVATAAITVINRHADFAFGTQYLRLLIWPIPRQLWPDKPVFTSMLDLNKYGHFRDLTISNYADTYSVMGLPSLVVMSVALGAFFSVLYRACAATQSALVYMFYWVVMIFLYIILRDGGVSVVVFWAFSMVAAWLLIRAGRVTLCSLAPAR